MREADVEASPDDPSDEFDIDDTAVWPVEDARLEPIFLAGPLWIEFEEGPQFELPPAQWPPDALLVGFEDSAEFDELDPARIEEAADEAPVAPRQRASAGSVLGSVGVHLLVLLALLGWSRPAGERGGTIPVQLVVAEPAPDNTAAATEASDTAAEPPKTAAAAPPPPPAQPRTAAEIPLPSRPAPQPEHTAAAESVARPNRPPSPTTEVTAESLNATERARQAVPASQGRVAGPAMTRDQYYAYLVTLTRRHLDLLPASLVGGRSGRTRVSVQVLRDGTISHVGIMQGSGYADIDARIEQMVSAVGHFPPLPEVFRGPSADLEFKLLFPNVYRQ